VLYLAGQYEEAVRQLQSTLEHALALGDGPGALGQLAYPYAVADRTEPALAGLVRLEDLAREGREAAFGKALIYHTLGDDDQALFWLLQIGLMPSAQA
jgi:hypothetical protein